MPVKVNFTSLGCAKNLVDSEIMLGHMVKHSGVQIVPDTTDCDVAVINTCGFIESSRKESIDQLLHLVEEKRSGRIRHIIAAGCLVQKHAAELAQEIPEIDAFLGTGELEKITGLLKNLGKASPQTLPDDPVKVYDHKSPRFSLTAPYSRYVKIAEGCNHTCSFCIIPQMRGKYRSRTVRSVVEEVKALSSTGLKEVNLISQETSYYGLDIDHKYHLPLLLRELDKIDPIKWIRIFYNHPQHMREEIIEAIGAGGKVLPYIDLPLQHINNRLLKSMNRGVTKEKTLRLLERIRAVIPGAVLRTTFIVGYPGETDAEFDELCAFVKETKFDHLGVFTYSRERDVPSGHLRGQLPEKIKKERYRRLMEIQQPISLLHNQRLIGTAQETLIERYDDASRSYMGRLRRHAPEIDGFVFVQSKNVDLQPGDFVSVRITSALPYDLSGALIP